MYQELVRTSATTYSFSLPKSVSVYDVLFLVSKLRPLTPEDYSITAVEGGYVLTLHTTNLPISGGIGSLWAFYRGPVAKKGSK